MICIVLRERRQRRAVGDTAGTKQNGDDMEKQMRLTGPDHPITIAPTGEHVVVRVGDEVVAQTDRALMLTEAGYADVQYIPIDDVDAASMRRSDHQTYCPYKGDASYYTVVTRAGDLENVIW